VRQVGVNVLGDATTQHTHAHCKRAESGVLTKQHSRTRYAWTSDMMRVRRARQAGIREGEASIDKFHRSKKRPYNTLQLLFWFYLQTKFKSPNNLAVPVSAAPDLEYQNCAQHILASFYALELVRRVSLLLLSEKFDRIDPQTDSPSVCGAFLYSYPERTRFRLCIFQPTAAHCL
jgi:hypothetical protein